MKQAITIFTDGSSRGNPGPGGFAAVIVIPEDKRVIEVGGHEEKTTNNRMEIQGAIGALLAIRKFEGDLIMYTDSSYLTQGITMWVHSWIKNGWITTNKETVLNKDLWEILTSLLYEREERDEKITWKHISGHVGIAGNERCDEIATAFADNKEITLFDGPLETYEHDVLSISHDDTKKETKHERKSRSKKAAYSYLSMVDGKIEKHATWAECEQRVKGVKGAKYKKALSEEEEKEIIASWQE